ncbi:phage holin family protein [Methylobacterium sp. J-076]|uniref:phage holin family protein n=1 Tax=Methylobacterium sp. J-076 TaxID=2836655 RepID=UPI001FBAA811|nr:phage holin family protein [Methylobacterium sp. J-076]MCJ2012505.1 phage holin family protein [Methylobacterium sp. J-076]
MRRSVPIQDLLAAAMRDGAGHIGQVLTLARIETDANLRAWLRLAGILGTIPILLVATFFLGLDAIVKMIAAVSGAPLLSALVVAAPFLIVALVLARLGAKRMALSNLEPWRTWRATGRPSGLARLRSPA